MRKWSVRRPHLLRFTVEEHEAVQVRWASGPIVPTNPAAVGVDSRTEFLELRGARIPLSSLFGQPIGLPLIDGNHAQPGCSERRDGCRVDHGEPWRRREPVGEGGRLKDDGPLERSRLDLNGFAFDSSRPSSRAAPTDLHNDCRSLARGHIVGTLHAEPCGRRYSAERPTQRVLPRWWSPSRKRGTGAGRCCARSAASPI